MQIKYRFVNEAVDVEVDEKWGAILLDLDRREYNNDQTETRRHASLNAMEYEGEAFIDPNANVANAIEKALESKNLQKAIGMLLPQQKELLRQVFCENSSVADIAREQGVSHVAILDRLKRIYRHLEKKL
jgi:DNA-directed RNA polymerase specialized sigma24 family protein